MAMVPTTTPTTPQGLLQQTHLGDDDAHGAHWRAL